MRENQKTKKHNENRKLWRNSVCSRQQLYREKIVIIEMECFSIENLKLIKERKI